MFIAFHKHLKSYENDRICQCGACTTASNLSLKFISHLGNVLVQEINNTTKLMGKDVTLAHKLMKNDIPDNEYILLSYTLPIPTDKNSNPSWLNLSESSTSYEDIGSIVYHYSSLSNLLEEVPKPMERDKTHFISKNPVHTSIIINKSILDVHSKLIDMNIRSKWRTPIGNTSHDLERIGSSHDCIIPYGNLPVLALDNIVQEGKIVYKEYSTGLGPLAPKGTEVFTLANLSNDQCLLSSDIHQETSSMHRWILRIFLKPAINKSFKKFKAICETS